MGGIKQNSGLYLYRFASSDCVCDTTRRCRRNKGLLPVRRLPFGRLPIHRLSHSLRGVWGALAPRFSALFYSLEHCFKV